MAYALSLLTAVISAAFDATLAERLESEVRGGPTFLPSFDANETRVFVKLEISAFT
jgi:uncharacterized protein involved in cysteine biosynthesis